MKTNRAVVFSCRPFPNLPEIWKTRLLQTLIDRVQLVCAQFFRTTTGIQSEPDAFDKSRFIMTFLTILGVMEILCNFRLVLEGKMGKEMPESSRFEFFEKFLPNNFVLSEDNTLVP